MPSIAGSFGRCSGPLAMHTKRARSSSPRLVATSQRPASSSHRMPVTSVWNRAPSYSPKCRPIARLCSRISEAPGVLLLRHVADLLEQRQVDVRLDVALRPRVAVPVPRAAEVAALLDEPDVGDPGLLQAGAGEQPAEASADDDHLDLIGDRVALDRLDVGIVDVVGEAALHLDVLVVAVGPQPLVALLAVLGPQGIGVERQRRHVGHLILSNGRAPGALAPFVADAASDLRVASAPRGPGPPAGTGST